MRWTAFLQEKKNVDVYSKSARNQSHILTNSCCWSIYRRCRGFCVERGKPCKWRRNFRPKMTIMTFWDKSNRLAISEQDFLHHPEKLGRFFFEPGWHTFAPFTDYFYLIDGQVFKLDAIYAYLFQIKPCRTFEVIYADCRGWWTY